MAGLLPHLVEEVRDAGVGEVGSGDDLETESSHQDRLEADAGVDDGGELLAREDLLLLVGQAVEELRDVRQAEDLVGEDLAVADLAGDVDVGLDDPLEGGRREAVDPLVHRGRRASGPASLGVRLAVGLEGGRLCVHARSHTHILHKISDCVNPLFLLF